MANPTDDPRYVPERTPKKEFKEIEKLYHELVSKKATKKERLQRVINALSDKLNDKPSYFSPQLLKILSNYPNDSIKIGVALNENAPRDVLVKLANNKEPYLLGYLTWHPRTPLPVKVKILKKLAKHSIPGVRGFAAESIHTPKDVLLRLAEDKDGYILDKLIKNPSTPTDALKKIVERNLGVIHGVTDPIDVTKLAKAALKKRGEKI